MIEFKHTLLPVPVRPAISKCGSVARSTTIGLPATSLPKIDRNAHLLDAAVGLFDHFAQADQLPLVVGNLDADRVFAWNGGDDANAGHAQGNGQIVGQAGDFRQPQARFEFDFVLRDDRPGFDFDDFHFEAETGERLLQHLGLLTHFFFVFFEMNGFTRQEQIERRKLIIENFLRAFGRVEFIDNLLALFVPA